MRCTVGFLLLYLCFTIRVTTLEPSVNNVNKFLINLLRVQYTNEMKSILHMNLSPALDLEPKRFFLFLG